MNEQKSEAHSNLRITATKCAVHNGTLRCLCERVFVFFSFYSILSFSPSDVRVLTFALCQFS